MQSFSFSKSRCVEDRLMLTRYLELLKKALWEVQGCHYLAFKHVTEKLDKGMLSLGLVLKMSMRNCVILYHLFWPFQGSSSRSDAFARMQGHPSRYQRPKRINDRQCWGQIGWFWRQRPTGSNDRSSQHFYWHPVLDGSRGKFFLFHSFNNRWNWCCGRFNFKQNTH